MSAREIWAKDGPKDEYRQPKTVEEARARRLACLQEIETITSKLVEWRNLAPVGGLKRRDIQNLKMDARKRICWLQREAARLKIAIPLCMAKANAKAVDVSDPDSLIRAAYKVLHRIACDLEGDIDEEEQKVIDALQFYCNGFGRTP